MPYKVAIGVSDIHLSHTAPACRAEEPDWYGAMERSLCQLKELASGLPVLFAGDLFDKHSPPPKLINFAMKHLPEPFYAIPGQHDLPYHGYERLEDSAFGTLVAAGKIISLRPNIPVRIDDDEKKQVWVVGYPWGKQPTDLVPVDKSHLTIAVTHRYCWHTPDTKHGGTVDSLSNVRYTMKTLGNFDVILVGDNHQAFDYKPICNCGGLMIRSQADLKRRIGPSVVLVYSDGSTRRLFLDVSQDVVTVMENAPSSESEKGFREFAQEVAQATTDRIDFIEAFRRILVGLNDKEAKKLAEECIDAVQQQG